MTYRRLPREARTPLRNRIATAVLAAALTPLALTLSAPAAHAASAGAPYDFNGDGRADLAIGAPGATVGGHAKAGAVSVVYGSSGGLKTSTRTLITQNTAGVPGAAEADDAFGSAVASADLNTDGYADLLIGAPGEDVDGDTNDGSAVVIWGSASGLSGARAVPNPNARDLDRYGQSVAAGDVEADGDLDILVGSTGPVVLTFINGPFTRSSSFQGGSGASADDQYATSYGITSLAVGHVTASSDTNLVLHGRKPGTDDAVTHLVTEPYIGNYTDWMQELPAGYVSAVGDIDKDGHADIAIGNERETSADPAGAKGGKVTVVYGGPAGLDSSRAPLVLTQDTAGVPGASESGDRFGSEVFLGDVNGDGYADLAVGASGENSGAGAVTVLYGSATGLRTTGVQTLGQDTAGVPGASESNDRFGARVLLADHSGDRRAELTVSATGENGDGAVWSLRGATTGVTTSGATNFGPAATGVSTAGSPAYGAALNS